MKFLFTGSPLMSFRLLLRIQEVVFNLVEIPLHT